MAVIGIDLGTTYCAAGIFVNGNPQAIALNGEPTMPSVVGLQNNGKIAIGKTAKANQARNPQNTIVEVKRKMGKIDEVTKKKVMVMLGQEEKSPQEISAMLLKQIKEYAEAELGDTVTGVVITCPAYFDDVQRAATKEAGQLAGLKVLKIINEPTAAAYAYGVVHDDSKEEKLFIVYDLGGGTFDVTVIRMIGDLLEVIGTGGDPNLGGGDFDDRIVNWMMDHLQKNYPAYASTLTDEKSSALRMKLKSFAEAGKIKLCDSQDANPSYTFQIPQVDTFQGKPLSFNETLTMGKFEELISDLLNNSLKWIDVAMKVPKEEKNYTEANVTAVLLVGGSTRVPMVRRLLEERFGRERVRGRECGINPDEIVALGAAIVAADTDPDSVEVAKKTLVDVTGHTLSVAAIDPRTGKEELCHIIPKETQIPCRGFHEFSTMGQFQEKCRIRVFQGEGKEVDPKKVTMIGEFEITVPRLQESIPLKIELELDGNGILIATATEGKNGQKVDCKLDYKDSAQMAPDELEKKRKALDAALGAVHRTAFNPLGDGQSPPAADGAANGGAANGAMGGASSGPASSGGRAAMNTIMQRLYDRAVNSFDRIPADRQGALFQLVGEIDSAVNNGDQSRLNSYFPQLQKLMEGV